MKLLFSGKRKKISLVIAVAVLLLIVSILISNNLASPDEPGYLELLEVKEERIQSIYRNIFYVKWHGRKTNLTFTLYKRTRIAGHGIPGGVGAQWNRTNGDIVYVKDGDICAARNGDTFKLSLSIFATYIKISYDNKTVWFHGSGEMQEIS